MVTWMSGLVAGLQNQLERFDSASDLQKLLAYSHKGYQRFFILRSTIPPPKKTNKIRTIHGCTQIVL